MYNLIYNFCMQKIQKETVINILIFLLFASLTFVVGIHHEPWADEAQAWLIARDCSYFDIIFHISKYEGTPSLWFCILRTLQHFHFRYEWLYIIPWICSCIGAWIFIFKSKLPPIIRYLFPFTYFIFYQYTIIARNYSLLFPMMGFVALSYPKRLTNPYRYAILLMLLSSISAQAFVLGFTLSGFWLFDFYKKYNKQIKNYLPCGITFLFLILTVLVVKKPADCIVLVHIEWTKLFSKELLNILVNGYFNEAKNFMFYIQFFAVLSLYVLSAKTFCKNKKQLLFFAGLNLSVLTILTVLYCHIWHSGFLITTLIFSLWVIYNENNNPKITFKECKMFYWILLFIFFTHILWSFKCGIFDISANYCSSKDVAKFVKKYQLETSAINGIGFSAVSVLPYFQQNIYDNYPKAYYTWDVKNIKTYYAKSENIPPIIIFSPNDTGAYKSIQWAKKYYHIYSFKGHMCAKGMIKESEELILFSRNKIK